jgi:hypothetical protein
MQTDKTLDENFLRLIKSAGGDVLEPNPSVGRATLPPAEKRLLEPASDEAEEVDREGFVEEEHPAKNEAARMIAMRISMFIP